MQKTPETNSIFFVSHNHHFGILAVPYRTDIVQSQNRFEKLTKKEPATDGVLDSSKKDISCF
jgi:hypothetical protein